MAQTKPGSKTRAQNRRDMKRYRKKITDNRTAVEQVMDGFDVNTHMMQNGTLSIQITATASSESIMRDYCAIKGLDYDAWLDTAMRKALAEHLGAEAMKRLRHVPIPDQD